MHRHPNETNFRCCFGILSRDHGAFNYLYRWSLRHMLTELLVVGLLIYLALQDYFIGIWCTIAAAISLFGASIPTCCFSNAMGWRANFVIQIIVCMIRVALVSYIIVYFTKVSFTANSLVPIRDMDLIAVRICQLACIILSTCSLSPFFHLSLKSPWMVNLRAVDDNFRVNQGNRNYNGHEGLMTDRSDNRSERNDYYENDSDYYPQKGHNARGSYSESQSDSEYHWNDKQNRNRYNENNHSHHNGDGNGREIENIEEGNEDGEDEDEEGEFDDNTTHKSVDQKPAMSMASMSPFYHQRKTSVFDFANKQDKEFDNPMSNFSQRSSVTSATFAPHLQPFSSNSSVTAGTQPQQFQQPSSNSKFDNSNSSKSGYSDQKSVNDAFNSPPDSPEQPVVVRAGKSNANKPAGDRETGFTPKTFSPKGLSPASENVLPPVSDSSSGTSSRATARSGRGDQESGSGSSGSSSTASPRVREKSELKDHDA